MLVGGIESSSIFDEKLGKIAVSVSHSQGQGRGTVKVDGLSENKEIKLCDLNSIFDF